MICGKWQDRWKDRKLNVGAAALHSEINIYAFFWSLTPESLDPTTIFKNDFLTQNVN